jgi:hypothetical protein
VYVFARIKGTVNNGSLDLLLTDPNRSYTWKRGNIPGVGIF